MGETDGRQTNHTIECLSRNKEKINLVLYINERYDMYSERHVLQIY